MKKLAVIAALVASVASANAFELGVRASGSNDAVGGGVSITHREPNTPFSVQLGVDRYSGDYFDFNKISLVGGYDFYKAGPATYAVKLGIASIDPSESSINAGVAGQIGLGLDYDLNKTTKLVVDLYHLKAAPRVSAVDDTYLAVGVQFKF